MEDVTEWRTEAKNCDLANALMRMEDIRKGKCTDSLTVQLKFNDGMVKTIASLKEFNECVRSEGQNVVAWRSKFD